MNRIDIINTILKKFKNPKFLEIGYGFSCAFNKIECKDKTTVDFNPYDPKDFGKNGKAYKLKSDEFFKINKEKYDFIFVDGDHEFEGVRKDFYNSLNCLNENGFIMLHDCNPPEKWRTRPRSEYIVGIPWNGDGGYKLICELSSTRPDLIWKTTYEDEGCCLIKKGNREIIDEHKIGLTSWEYFDKNRNHILNLISIKELINEYSKNTLSIIVSSKNDNFEGKPRQIKKVFGIKIHNF